MLHTYTHTSDICLCDCIHIERHHTYTDILKSLT